MADSNPAFNFAQTPIVTEAGYATGDMVLLLQTLIMQAARSTPITVLFDNLPANPYLGQPAAILDSTTAIWGAVIAGGGAFGVLGVWTGANWTVMGKA